MVASDTKRLDGVSASPAEQVREAFTTAILQRRGRGETSCLPATAHPGCRVTTESHLTTPSIAAAVTTHPTVYKRRGHHAADRYGMQLLQQQPTRQQRHYKHHHHHQLLLRLDLAPSAAINNWPNGNLLPQQLANNVSHFSRGQIDETNSSLVGFI